MMVPPIWLILLSINFDIPPVQGLMVSIIELSSFQGENFQHMAHHTPLLSQRGCMGTRFHGHNISAMATSGTALFRRKATPHTGGHHFHYHDGSIVICVALQGQVLSQSQPHTNTQYRISIGEKRCHYKHPHQSPLDNDKKQGLRKNTLWAAISIGRVFSA